MKATIETTKEKIDKVIHIGRGEYGNIFCKIEFNDGKLSITGVEGPTSDGNCKGSCGQIDTAIKGQKDKIQFTEGWTLELLEGFLAIWDRWHLNDLRDGSPAQEQYLREHPITVVYPQSHYELASKVLADAGLNPDNGYSYGRAWNREQVEPSALEFLHSLPETTITPAWV